MAEKETEASEAPVEELEQQLPEEVEVQADAPTEEPKAEGKEDAEGDGDAPAPAEEDWRDKRIAKLTAKLREAQTQKPPAGVAPQGSAESDADFAARVAEEAARQVAARDYNERTNAVVEAGRSAFGSAEFDARIRQLQSVVDQTDEKEVAAYHNLVQTGLEAGHLDKIIYELGGDPARTAKLLALSPTKMAVELTKMAAKFDAPEAADPGVSRAPKPITPLNSGRATHVAIDPTDPSRADNLSTAEWMARRNKQLESQRTR